MPRSLSWPDRRTGWPSSSRVVKASASAVDQSMPAPSSRIALRRASRKRWMVRWAWKPSGTVVIFSPMARSSSRSTPVTPRRGSSSLAAAFEAGPAAVQPVGLVRLVGLAGLVLGVEPRAPLGAHAVDLARLQHALGFQLAGVDLQRGRVLLDDLVHQGLGEGRLVALVMAEAAIAEHVHHHRLLEALAELGGDLGREGHRLRVVAVHVEDRRLDGLRHIRRIGRGAREARIGGEADLVVDDEMDRAAGAGDP